MDWTFDEAPNTAALTSSAIISENDWIAYVSHDADDGGWQFHGVSATTDRDAVVVALAEIVDLDP